MKAKIPRNMHFVIAGVMLVLVVIAVTVQSLWTSSSEPEVVANQPPPIDPRLLNERPNPDDLKAEISRQKGPEPKPEPKPEPRQVPTDVTIDSSKEEAEKAAVDQINEAAAASPIIAINRGVAVKMSAAAQQTLGGAALPPGINLPPSSTSQRDVMAEAERQRAQQMDMVKTMLANQQESNRPQLPDTRNQNVKWIDQYAERANRGALRPDPARAGIVIHEGTPIRAVTLSAVNSDLPGMVTALVTTDVYDTRTGRDLALPRGSRLIGEYNSSIEMGQVSVLGAFHRIILPDGRSISLPAFQAANHDGASGVPGKVDTHFWDMFWSSALLATIGYAVDRAIAPKENTTSVTIQMGNGGSSGNTAGEIIKDTSETALRRFRDRAPTIYIEQGTEITVMANRDIVF